MCVVMGMGKISNKCLAGLHTEALSVLLIFNLKSVGGAVRFEWFILCPFDMHGSIWEMWRG